LGDDQEPNPTTGVPLVNAATQTRLEPSQKSTMEYPNIILEPSRLAHHGSGS
jgi:hypothetical protein